MEGHDANGPVPHQDRQANATSPAREGYHQQRALSTRSAHTYRAPVLSTQDVERLRMSMDLVVGQNSAAGNGLLGQFVSHPFELRSKTTLMKIASSRRTPQKIVDRLHQGDLQGISCFKLDLTSTADHKQQKLTGEKPIPTQTGFDSTGRTVFPRFIPRQQSRSDYYRARPGDRRKFSDRRRAWYRTRVRCGGRSIDIELKKPDLDTIFEQPGLEE